MGGPLGPRPVIPGRRPSQGQPQATIGGAASTVFVDRYGREIEVGDHLQALLSQVPTFIVAEIKPDLRPGVPAGAVRVRMESFLDLVLQGGVPAQQFCILFRPPKEEEAGALAPAEGDAAAAAPTAADASAPADAPKIQLTD